MALSNAQQVFPPQKLEYFLTTSTKNSNGSDLGITKNMIGAKF